MITAIYGQYDELENFLFRSWQSMKERFRKKILPVIHISFRKVLTKESLDNFEKYAKGLKVDTPPSTENSEDESIEREMNQALAQSTPISSRCSFTSFCLSFKRYRKVFVFKGKSPEVLFDAKLCNQVPSLSLSRCRTPTLLKI